jgi:hypothetical protein
MIQEHLYDAFADVACGPIGCRERIVGRIDDWVRLRERLREVTRAEEAEEERVRESERESEGESEGERE